MIDITDELKKLVANLENQDIDYALCGGMAMAVHQLPRMTVDIDLVIEPESVDAVMAIASRLGYTIRGMDMSFAQGAVEIRRISKIDAEAGDLLSLDFLLVTPEIRSAWEDRIEVSWEGGNLKVVSREGLIHLKSLRRSGQDLDDIEALKGEAHG